MLAGGSKLNLDPVPVPDAEDVHRLVTGWVLLDFDVVTDLLDL